MANGNGNLPKGMNKAQAKKANMPKGKSKSWLQKTGGKVGGAIAGFARKQAGAPAAATAPTKLKSMRDMAKGKNGNGNGN